MVDFLVLRFLILINFTVLLFDCFGVIYNKELQLSDEIIFFCLRAIINIDIEIPEKSDFIVFLSLKNISYPLFILIWNF